MSAELTADRAADHQNREMLLAAAERAMTYHDGNGDTFHRLLAEHFRESVGEGHLLPSLLALASEVVEWW